MPQASTLQLLCLPGTPQRWCLRQFNSQQGRSYHSKPWAQCREKRMTIKSPIPKLRDSTAFCVQTTRTERSPSSAFTSEFRGLRAQAYRPTGGTNSIQRQQYQLTPEITRWQKPSTITLPTETKATWQHQKPVLPTQQVPDTPTHHKCKSLI